MPIVEAEAHCTPTDTHTQSNIIIFIFFCIVYFCINYVIVSYYVICVLSWLLYYYYTAAVRPYASLRAHEYCYGRYQSVAKKSSSFAHRCQQTENYSARGANRRRSILLSSRKSPLLVFYIVFICERESPQFFYIIVFVLYCKVCVLIGTSRVVAYCCYFKVCAQIAADILLFCIKGANRRRFIIVFFVSTIRAFFIILIFSAR